MARFDDRRGQVASRSHNRRKSAPHAPAPRPFNAWVVLRLRSSLRLQSHGVTFLIMQQGIRRFRGRCIGRIRVVLAAVAAMAWMAVGLPADALGAPTMITEFPVAAGHPSDLEGLAVGADGNIWFQDHWWPEGSYHALIGRMDGAGNVEEFDEGLSKYSSPAEFVAGPDGNLWFADDGSALGGASVGRITPTGAITTFASGLGGGRPRTIDVGPDGNLWFTGVRGNPVIGFATLEGAITAFALPGKPWDAVGGPDGNIWFTYGGEGATPAIGRLEMQEGGGAVVTLFHSGLSVESEPYEILSAQDGYLWFSDIGGTTPTIGRVSSGGEIKEFTAGAGAEGGIWDITAGPAGNIWFTDRGGDNVGRVTPLGQISEFGNGELDEPQYITAGSDGNMWFTYSGGIGKVSPSGTVTRLRDGLGPSANPQEIVNAPDGRLWFISNSWTDPAIGRVIPGDDSPPSVSPPPAAPPVERPSSPPPVGRLALRTARISISRSGKAILRLACQSSIACSGKIRLVGFRRGWKAPRLIGASVFSIAAWGSAGVRIRLNRVGRKFMALKRRARVRLKIAPSSELLALDQPIWLRSAGRTRHHSWHRRRVEPTQVRVSPVDR